MKNTIIDLEVSSNTVLLQCHVHACYYYNVMYMHVITTCMHYDNYM